MTELVLSQSKLLGALTLTALKHLGGNTLTVDADNNLCPGWRIVRVGNIALVEKPVGDQQLPQRIDVYQIVDYSTGGAFKLDPARLVYSLRWQHKAEPPDFKLVLVQAEPQHWVNTANLTLLAELRRRAPHAIEWPLVQDDVVPMLDAFEAAQDGRTA